MENSILVSRAAVYVRSVAELDNFGEIERQRNICEEYIRDHGYELAGVYMDNGASGSTLQRPAMDRLRADAAAGKFDRIVVVDLSRIARNRLLLEQFIYEMQAQVIFIDCVKEMSKR